MNGAFARNLTIRWHDRMVNVSSVVASQEDADTLIEILRLMKSTLPGPIPPLPAPEMRVSKEAGAIALQRMLDPPESITPEPQETAPEASDPAPESITPAEQPAEPEEADDEADDGPEPPETPDEPEEAPERPEMPADAPLQRTPKAIVTELWSSDLTIPEIAKEAGVSAPRVHQIKKELGLPERKPKAEPEPPEPAPEPEPPPEPEHKPAHIPRPESKPAAVVSRGHIRIDTTYDAEAIIVGDKRMDVSTSAAAVLGILLKAAPSPVGEKWITDRVYPSVGHVEAENRLAVIVKDLTHGLPTVGLELKAFKGVGLALGGVA
ncbi:hypothetical protein [Bauldia litoralis]|uniref:hypothetical protein n=1 Tax=Bauldia litoralis TaxID=665467 RepID=UPI003264847A